MKPFRHGEPGLNEVAARARGGQEHGERPRDGLAPVVGAQERRRAPPLDGPLQHALDAQRLEGGPDPEREALPRELVLHAQDLELRAVEAGVVHEIQAPDLVPGRWPRAAPPEPVRFFR